MYLVTSDDRSISPNRSHVYYQVLTQVHVFNVDNGDFCLCTFQNHRQAYTLSAFSLMMRPGNSAQISNRNFKDMYNAGDH